VPRGGKCLEIGADWGHRHAFLKKYFDEIKGVEIYEPFVEESRKQGTDVTLSAFEETAFPDGSFDFVWSWGVIHHSPDTIKCLKEIIRVTRPGGVIKIMIYNRRSLFAFYQWIIYGLLKGKFLKSLKTILFEYQESPGTKAYTFKEVKKMLKGMPIILCNLKATTTNHDLLYYKSKSIQFCAKVLAGLLGWNKIGWFMTLDLQKQELI